MNAKDSVYPTIQISGGAPFTINLGIDLRTHLASMAMQGILSNKGFDETIGDVVINSIAYADALISELKKPFSH